MLTKGLLTGLIVLAAWLAAWAMAAGADEDFTALSVAGEVARIAAEGELWPDFDPAAYPLAIYDGKSTYLFNHPSPPEELSPVEGREDAFMFAGQHETIRANTALDIGGVQTATVMMNTMEDKGLRAVAAVAVHELFHVFQAEHRPQWPHANEAEAFTYPLDDPELLALRRLETEAFRRAVLAEEAEARRGWALRALLLRAERFVLMPEGAAQYERGNELIEGTAHYIQAKAERNPELVLIPPGGFAPEKIRQRTYAVGNAIALLLDEFRPEWKRERAGGELAPLDGMLQDALGAPMEAELPDFTADERAAILQAAQTDTAAVAAKREEFRQRFGETPGFAVTVVAEGAPLAPRGFDPMNVQSLGGREVLHLRFLRLANEDSALEVLDRWALTEGAGEHPLFNGVRRVTVRGLAGEPRLSMVDGKLRVEAEGFTGEFAGAKVETVEDGLVITLR